MIFDNTNYDLTFVHLNDIHGRVNGENNSISFPKLFTFLESLRNNKKNGKVFLIDSGDTLHGTPFANFSKGESIITLFNALKFDYVTIGNHDFNYGFNHLKSLINLQTYKTLALNLIDKNNNTNILPYDIVTFNKFNICFFGLLTPETYYKTNSKNIINLEFTNPEESVKNLLNNLENKNIDLFVGITHLGCDKSTKIINQSFNLANNFSKIDIIFDGHSHTEIKEKCIVNNTLISQAGSYNKNIAIIQLNLNDKKSKWKYKLMSSNDLDYYENNFYIENIIANIQNTQNSISKTTIAYSKFPLIGDRESVRCKETNLTQLITDAILWKTNSDAVLINGGSIRESISQGYITIEDIFKSIPFNNHIVTKKIKGSNLKEALENGLKAFPEPLGAMAQVSGMRVVFNPNNPPYKRVSEIYIKNNPIILDNYYNIAVTDFMSSGGEEYTSLIQGENINYYSSVEDIVIDYLKNIKIEISPQINSRLIYKIY
ncbi:MAG: bifunctional metallophosphatase/5'-nucleotidase [Cetobacterium somerae]|uniref:bifunctional metallophosphatase/5'-nucleotidase n=1 Tax=Cetobacterium somerae TaxID=188913 RepID=UPI00248D82BD|nr:bifunctional UDP-sugar hydrolase/5'-nucleotidase [Cetobacterium somerae]WVJ03180.1 bifunctional UDP-sugar hydrolase/5'-nucleotidase [Cetobacterium somerae]